MMIPRNTTSEHPTRYRAWEAPRVLWLQSRDVPAKEVAVYAEKMPNTYHAGLDDGVYVEVRHLFGAQGSIVGYRIEAQATKPIQGREPFHKSEEVRRPGFSTGAGLQDALTVADRLIREACAFVGVAAPAAPACTVRVDERCPYYDPRVIRGDAETRVECPTCAGILST